MRKIFGFIVFSAALAPFAMAASWSGALLDSSCYDTQYQQSKDMQKSADACAATSSTSSFALYLASGKVYKLDSGGNSKASSALKSRADRSAPGQSQSIAKIDAKVDGTESGGTIKADTVEVQ